MVSEIFTVLLSLLICCICRIYYLCSNTSMSEFYYGRIEADNDEEDDSRTVNNQVNKKREH